MRKLMFARLTPLRDKWSIEALYSDDLMEVEEQLLQNGINFSMYTGKVGENYITIPVDQKDVDRDTWARDIVQECNFIDVPDTLDTHMLQADTVGNVYEYAKLENRDKNVTFREYAAMVVLNRCVESANSRWSDQSPASYLMDELDDYLGSHPRIAVRALLQLKELLENY